MTEDRKSELHMVAQLLQLCSAACMDMIDQEPLTNLATSAISLSLNPKTDDFMHIHQTILTFLNK